MKEFKYYMVIRPHDNVLVTIIPCRMDGKFHFVNITKNHICECGFNTYEEAEADLEKYKKLGKINSYITFVTHDNKLAFEAMLKIKHGYWEPGYPTTCSVCGGEAPTVTDNDIKYSWEEPGICPHCNAIMDEQVENIIPATILFNKHRFKYDEHVAAAIAICEANNGYIQIDECCNMYVKYKEGGKFVTLFHAYAEPLDKEWFSNRFKEIRTSMSVTDMRDYLNELIESGYGNYKFSNDGYCYLIKKENITIDERNETISL